MKTGEIVHDPPVLIEYVSGVFDKSFKLKLANGETKDENTNISKINDTKILLKFLFLIKNSPVQKELVQWSIEHLDI